MKIYIERTKLVNSSVKIKCFSLALNLTFALLPIAANAAKSSEQTKALNSAAFIAYEKDDLVSAYRNYDRAAKLGEPSALYNIAVMRINDEVKHPSLAQAHQSLKRSAQLGFAPAQFMLGTILETDEKKAPSKAGKVDEVHKMRRAQAIMKAVSWYEKAALQGHPDASLALGTAYFLGRGTNLDYAKALRWYTQAAEFGDVAAQYLVASMYESATGTSKNLDTALMWYIAAARQGDVAAREKSKYLNEIILKERQS
jgi:uncharacterized protein